jgi:hypothetical protein
MLCRREHQVRTFRLPKLDAFDSNYRFEGAEAPIERYQHSCSVFLLLFDTHRVNGDRGFILV